jgi:hypothetical protein
VFKLLTELTASVKKKEPKKKFTTATTNLNLSNTTRGNLMD